MELRDGIYVAILALQILERYDGASIVVGETSANELIGLNILVYFSFIRHFVLSSLELLFLLI